MPLSCAGNEIAAIGLMGDRRPDFLGDYVSYVFEILRAFRKEVKAK
jgi:hypothetical protein